MEVVGSVAAVLQLVQAVGKTVVQVNQVYHDVRDMDDTLRNFDNQLGATQMMLSVLSDSIQRSTLGPSTPPWWNQDVLEGLLNSCNRSYSRLGAIFSNISRQMSSGTALGAYIKKRRYDSDINLLRHSIDTYTTALQLPVLIQTIQGCSTNAQSPAGDIASSFNELMRRIDNLQSSIDHLDHDLVTRALRKTEILTPQQERSEEAQEELGAVEKKEKLDMENDTRATLGVLKGLMDHAKDYASSIESASTSSRLKKPLSKARRDHRDTTRAITSSTPQPSAVASSNIDSGIRLPPKKRQDVSDWAGNVDHGDNLSSASLDDSLPSVTTTTQSALSTSTKGTSTKGTSILGELHERRIQTVERLMKEKMFDRAIPHLDRLLRSSSEPEFAQNASQSARSLAKALVHSHSNDSTVEYYCQKFPSIRALVEEYQLQHGLCLLERRKYDEVIVLLQSYKSASVSSKGCSCSQSPKSSRESPKYSAKLSAEASAPDFIIRQKIQIILCRALLQSSRANSTDEAFPILQRLLKQCFLDSAGKGDAHWLLAEAHYFKGNFEDAKPHGLQACQIKMDTLGRDHEETTSCIKLMANICLYNNDPDEDLWRGMLSHPKLTNVGMDTSPPKFSHAQDRLISCTKEMQKLAAKDPSQAAKLGVKYLKENYSPILSQRMSAAWFMNNRDFAPRTRESLSDFFFFDKPVICWECLSTHMEKTHTLAGVAVGAVCRRHGQDRPSGFTGLSPFHFFAMAVPRYGRWESRGSENCVEEMNAILEIAQMENPGRQTTDEIINATMHYMTISRAVSALWLAAIHDNQAAVNFLLSLGQTNAAQGSTLLQNTTYDGGRKRMVQLSALFEPIKSPIFATERCWGSFLKAFDALTSEEACQLLQPPTPTKWPWWFSCPFMLDRFLTKCGRKNWDIQYQAGKGVSGSLLRLLVQSVAVPSSGSHPLLLESSDIKKLFWTIWKHGKKASNLRFMMQAIRTTIDSIPYFYKQRVYVEAKKRLQLWFFILDQLETKNVKLDDKSRRVLEEFTF
ncbi:hypothetical protein CEP52_002142 [Fusarium oligoseptatum]|uniref:Fungal N-terminal domain-containing protein n=1 Tax=Fusarium oligoseptatum TaxID=2604345 RepID=A0A428UFW3_9HYPO|nr:hypothetical protein CEP52_002142 [Fusarium oligoseptatum]